MAGVLVELFRHNVWANLRLLAFCEGLSDEHLDAAAPGTYGRVRDTLVHLLAAEGRYVALFSGKDPTDPLREGDAPSFAELRERARRSGDGLAAEAARTRAGRMLRGVWRGERYAVRAAVILIAAINHATEHRTQIGTILGQRGLTPPVLDAGAYDATGGVV